MHESMEGVSVYGTFIGNNELAYAFCPLIFEFFASNSLPELDILQEPLSLFVPVPHHHSQA